jgi:flagellar protein FlaI
VYDRVVNDLGVPPTSFKATDIIPICKSLRSADGLHRFRRMTEITEVRKKWEEDPVKEGGFVNLMEYSGKEDMLKPTDTFVNGESEVLNRIASYVREWSGNWEAVWENIQLRAKVKQTLVEMSEKLKMPELIEAEWVVKSNSVFHLIGENIRKEIGFPDPERIYLEWENWLKKELKVVGK